MLDNFKQPGYYGKQVPPVEIPVDRLNSLFGSKLSRLRRSRGLSQSELGKRLGLSRTTIANLERGVQNVQLHQVFALARALDADPGNLIPVWREIAPGSIGLSENLRELIQTKLREIQVRRSK